ncbi:MAG: DUF3040 domain-containing protein [Acidimicrobiales bacterium]
MSTRDDAGLSPRERAALAHLEQRAEADDPALAAALRGRGSDLRQWLRKLPALPKSPWWGGALSVAGLVIMIAFFAASTLAALAGAAIAGVGLWMLAAWAAPRLSAHLATRSKPTDQPVGEPPPAD